MKHCFYLIGILLIQTHLFAQTWELRGRVLDSDVEEPLFGANVYLECLELFDSSMAEISIRTFGKATNIAGEYKVANIPIGKWIIHVSFIAHQSIQDTIDVQSKIILKRDYYLNFMRIYERWDFHSLTIIDKSITNHRVILTRDQLRNIPADW